MPTPQTRNLPPEACEALALRAKAEHRSLAQQAVAELEKMPELEARRRRLAVVRQIKERLSPDRPCTLPSPETLVREDRER